MEGAGADQSGSYPRRSVKSAVGWRLVKSGARAHAWAGCFVSHRCAAAASSVCTGPLAFPNTTPHIFDAWWMLVRTSSQYRRSSYEDYEFNVVLTGRACWKQLVPTLRCRDATSNKGRRTRYSLIWSFDGLRTTNPEPRTKNPYEQFSHTILVDQSSSRA